jgi:hypothetical protein
MSLAPYKVSGFAPQLHRDYLANLPQWEYLDDLYVGSSAWLQMTNGGFEPTDRTQLYIPRHVAETFDNWRSRINGCHFDDLFSQAVRRFVGMVLLGGLRFDNPDSDFVKYIDTIDVLTGNAEALISRLAIASMTYGHTYVMVDYPVVVFETLADYLNSGAMPYWVQIDPQNFLDWRTDIIDGKLRFTYAMVRVVEDETIYFYDYSLTSWSKYLQFVYEGSIYYRLVDSGSLNWRFIPIVPLYGGIPTGACTSIPPLKAIADKNRTLYQKVSDHYRKILLCCHPVPVLRDSMRSQDEPLEIGANSFLSISDPNGSFKWEEPLALSLEQSRRDINDLRESIARDSADFLTEPADRQSASATNLLTHPVESSLASFIRTFQAGINNAIAIHCDMLDIEVPKINLEANVFPDSIKDSQALFAINTIAESGIISKDEARIMIKELGFTL